MIKEIKRVIKESEIMKCGFPLIDLDVKDLVLIPRIGKTTRNGPRRTRTVVKSSRFV